VGVFADLPVAGKEWMTPWIEQFYNEGITTGCGVAPSGSPLYCPESPVSRAEMAAFIDRAFKFPLVP
jgi:predicted metalloprotease